MKQQVPQEFQKWHFVFRSRESELPKNIQMKLLFIASKIYDQQFDRSIFNKELLEEHDQLDRLDKVSLTILFKTLIKTFLKDKTFVELECKIKYKGVLEVWKNSKISLLEQNLMFIFEKSIIKYDLKYISISNCLKSKKSFDIIFKRQVIATIKFYTLENYSDFKQFIQAKVEQKKEQKRIEHQMIKNLTNKKQQLYQVIPLKISPLQEIKLNQNITESRKSRSSQNQSPTQTDELLYKQKPEGFFVDYQKQNINIFLSKLQAKIYITMILKIKTELQRVVNFYLHQKQWNSFVTDQVITQIQENLFQTRRTFKKDSFFEFQRVTVTKTSVFCTKNSANIAQQTILDAKSDKIICQNTSTTKFFKCLGGIKINIECSFDAKGYCKLKDSQYFLKKIYEDIKYLENSIKINDLQMKNMKMIIIPESNLHLSFLKEPYLKKNDHLSRQLQNQIDNIGTNDTIELPNRKQNDRKKYPLVFQLRMTKPSQTPTLEYMKQIINCQHEKRYLRMRFDESILKDYDNSTPSYCLSQLLKKNQYTISKEKELIFINNEVIKGQKNSLIFVLKQIGTNIFSGKQILNVSLPVDIFQSRSLLERSAACFGLAPDYLIPIADSDPLTQIKNIVTLICSIPTLQLIMLKPFNPILGQTFQAYIKGIPIYYQQISHHPPISSFYMTCPQFTIHGNLIPFADVSVNSALGGNEGITYIKLRNGSQFQCYFPPCQIGGLIFGNRTFRAYGRGYILQKNKNIFAEFSIQKQKKGLYENQTKIKLKAGDIIGGIFKIDPKTMKNIAQQASLRKFSGLDSKNVEAKLASIKGTWFEQIRIDNEIMNKNKKIYPLQYQRSVLPSDSNYRLDVLYHKLNDISQSQLQKEILQRKQRGDRKLREKYYKLHKKQK